MTSTRFRLALVAAASGLLAACGGGDAETEAPETAAPAEEAPEESQAPAEPQMIPAPEGSQAADAMIIGAEDAPVTIVEYASVTCPGCAAFHTQVYPSIKEELIETGMMRMEFRELPTAPQRVSFAGFILARCAATDAGPAAYFGVIDALFKRQNQWVRAQNPGAELRNIGAQAGIDGEAFDQCYQRQDIRDAIVENIEEARDRGVQGTPSFYVDGKPFDMPFVPEDAVAALKAEVEKRR
ncbi:DsbA family protein [Parvularcula sp. ZS-1/3]|uniref:DsbA family protein n=1 Tax=Parvularcula mediterranea TaxID=2732508 RepID=A0A7Y3W457_9PROT|nr:DsbA family protein [Parvularcula mediterranea]NNU15128.1 DsbA family protein [Parvularcula mediterranea]